jgi:hypothetical protein
MLFIRSLPMLSLVSVARKALAPLVVLALVSVLSLLTSAPASAQYTHRLTRIVYDFDANGMPDADRNVGYNGAGEVVSTDYTYFGDGTLDLFNTEDDATVQEDGVYGYDGSGRMIMADVDRGVESFETTTTFTAGEFDRIDFVGRNGSGAVVNDVYFDFTYTGGDLTEVVNRETSNNALINTLSVSYGANGLPDAVDLLSTGISIFNTLAWNADGNVTTISSTASGGFGTGSATMTYLPGSGQLDNEVWTQTGFVGSLFSEFPGNNYRKTYTYDANTLRTTESVDIDDNGSVEAILTYEWTAGSCNPSFQYAPNGRPNFSGLTSDGRVPDVYVPGTGATYIENCGPFPVPEPSFGLLVGIGSLALARAGRGAKRRAL